jgi:phage recombination protein Bet
MTDSALVTAPAATLSSGQILSGLRTVASVLAPDLSADELKLFAMVASRSGLDPFAKQIYAVKRKGRVTFQTGIDGYRSIAARTGLYDGQDEPEYGPECGCGGARPKGHPESATVRVYRKGVSRAIAATAFWHEYVPEAGQSGNGDAMWVRMPRVMIAKVAEALALRKAFPYDPENRQGIGADVYTADEMTQADRAPAPAAPQPSARERVAQRAAALVEPEPEPTATDAGEVEGTFVEAPAEEPPLPTEPPAKAAPVADGLTRERLKDLCVTAGKSTVAISRVLGCAPEEVGARVNAMSDAERGVLADELNIDWRTAA